MCLLSRYLCRDVKTTYSGVLRTRGFTQSNLRIDSYKHIKEVRVVRRVEEFKDFFGVYKLHQKH